MIEDILPVPEISQFEALKCLGEIEEATLRCPDQYPIVPATTRPLFRAARTPGRSSINNRSA